MAQVCSLGEFDLLFHLIFFMATSYYHAVYLQWTHYILLWANIQTMRISSTEIKKFFLPREAHTSYMFAWTWMTHVFISTNTNVEVASPGHEVFGNTRLLSNYVIVVSHFRRSRHYSALFEVKYMSRFPLFANRLNHRTIRSLKVSKS